MKERTKKALVAVAVGIVLNIALASIKLFVGLRTNSLCIMLDSINGFFDTGTGIITVIAFAICFLPESEKFPYGRGRAEYAAGFVISAISIVMGGIFFFDSLNRIMLPEPVWFGIKNAILVAVGVPIKLLMAIFYRILGKKLKSVALKAISMDCFLDVGITTATLISFTVSSSVNYAVDSVFGIVISVVVIACGIKMVIDYVGLLCGAKGNTEEQRSAIIDACREQPLVGKIKKIALHDYGYMACVGMVELEFIEHTSMEMALAVCEELAKKLKETKGANIDFVVCGMCG